MGEASLTLKVDGYCVYEVVAKWGQLGLCRDVSGSVFRVLIALCVQNVTRRRSLQESLISISLL